MIQPVQSDLEFIADVQNTLSQSSTNELHLWWLGQSGFLLVWNQHCFLFDPYLSDSLTRKYAATDKPHVRMTRRVVDPAVLDFVEVVTSSHMHTDHMDAETLIPMIQANPSLVLVIPEANRAAVAERLKYTPTRLQGLDAGEQIRVGAFVIHGIPASHNTLEKDERGKHRFMGYVVEAGPFRIYHSGDTLYYEGIQDWLAPYQLDLSLLPINGNKPERIVAGNLDGVEAARLALETKTGCVVPCHYEMFEFNTASPHSFVNECSRLGQKCQVMHAGEKFTLRKL